MSVALESNESLYPFVLTEEQEHFAARFANLQRERSRPT